MKIESWGAPQGSPYDPDGEKMIPVTLETSRTALRLINGWVIVTLSTNEGWVEIELTKDQAFVLAAALKHRA